MGIGPRILSTSPRPHYMKIVFHGVWLNTVIPPNVSDLTSFTRAEKSKSGELGPIPTLFIMSHFWTRSAQQHNLHSKATAPSQLTLRGRVSPKVTSSHDDKETRSSVGPRLGAQGKHEEDPRNSFGFAPVLLRAEFGPALREGEKYIHWIYLPEEWTRQISILKGIAFKSSVDFENNIIAWYHKQFPIFRSSRARLSVSPNSDDSITAEREMELQWTGMHFP